MNFRRRGLENFAPFFDYHAYSESQIQPRSTAELSNEITIKLKLTLQYLRARMIIQVREIPWNRFHPGLPARKIQIQSRRRVKSFALKRKDGMQRIVASESRVIHKFRDIAITVLPMVERMYYKMLKVSHFRDAGRVLVGGLF